MERNAPNIPAPRDDDPEEVADKLSIAAAMWARGETGDALQWLRRAAESASDAEADLRALELAKAAAELANAPTSAAISGAGSNKPEAKAPMASTSPSGTRPATSAPAPMPQRPPTRPPTAKPSMRPGAKLAPLPPLRPLGSATAAAPPPTTRSSAAPKKSSPPGTFGGAAPMAPAATGASSGSTSTSSSSSSSSNFAAVHAGATPPSARTRAAQPVEIPPGMTGAPAELTPPQPSVHEEPDNEVTSILPIAAADFLARNMDVPEDEGESDLLQTMRRDAAEASPAMPIVPAGAEARAEVELPLAVGVRVRVFVGEAGAWVVPDHAALEGGIAAILVPASPGDDMRTLFTRS